MNKLRRAAAVLVAAVMLTAVTAPAATAAPKSARAAERAADRPLWAADYLMGTVRDWPCASKGARTCGVYSKATRTHYLVTFDRSGDVADIVKRRASVRDA